MLRIVSHIERLLLIHDCVIVPNFGGFVLQTVPTACNRLEHHFSPYRKEIGFNRTLQHSDGLLVEAYMRQYAVDYRKAQVMVEEDVEEMKRLLSSFHKLTMESLGVFETDGDGRLVFFPSRTALFELENYGLPAFHMPPLPSLQNHSGLLVNEKAERKDVFYIPVSRRFLQIVAASAAAVTLFLLLSTPVKDVDRRAYQAGFIPTGIVSERSVAVAESKEVPASVAVQPERTETISETTVPESVASETKADQPAQPALKRKTFHIVIASFATEAQAETYMSEVDRTLCREVGIVQRDGKYRVYAAKFDDREIAERSMTALRAYPKYKDAWIFISR